MNFQTRFGHQASSVSGVSAVGATDAVAGFLVGQNMTATMATRAAAAIHHWYTTRVLMIVSRMDMVFPFQNVKELAFGRASLTRVAGREGIPPLLLQ
jgi:hypothetical protein